MPGAPYLDFEMWASCERGPRPACWLGQEARPLSFPSHAIHYTDHIHAIHLSFFASCRETLPSSRQAVTTPPCHPCLVQNK